MALLAKLLGRRGEQQHATRDARQLLDELVLGAGVAGCPLQVVCLVHNQQVPLAFDRLLATQRVGHQGFQCDQHLLLGMKRVFLAGALGDGATALLVEDAERQVEAAQHLHQPLVQQALGYHDQHAPCPLGQQLLMQDQAGLYGLAEPDLIGEQDPRCMSAGDLMGDVELVRNQAGARARQAAQTGL